MHEIISAPSWLRMLANELESKNFPSGYGPQLRRTADILESTQAEFLQMDNVNVQLGINLAKKEEEFVDLRQDMVFLWRRYQAAIEVIGRYDQDLALELSKYKPKFHESLI
jgi:hypothetical protein